MVGQLLLVAGAYLLGSLPFGYWAGRMAGVDIRAQGSGNTGATNVFRVLGKRYGIPVLVLDIAKGLVPTLIGLSAFGAGVAVLAGVAAVLGHMFPLLLGFGGGKGVATACGVALALAPLLVLAALVVFVALLWLWRWVSLASMIAAVVYAALATAVGEPWPVLVFAWGVTALIIYRHRANIARLRAGTESRVSSFGRGS